MKAKIIGLLLCLWVGSTFASPLHKIVAFGDSLSDNGNLYRYMHKQIPISPPYYKGRFTSGPVWVELVAEHYFPGDAANHLVDYAFGGSGIDAEEEEDEEDDFNDGAMLTLKAQVDSYLLAHNDKVDSSNLYTVWMGANNYLGIPDVPDDEINMVLSGIEKELVRLVEKGAKHIMVVGLPDLGRTPMAAEFESEKELTYLAEEHNLRLEARVHALEATYPEVSFIFFNVNELFTNALDHPEKYGFKDIKGTCYDAIDYDYEPSSQTILNMAARVKPHTEFDESICDTFLFFDPVHPSARPHQFISEEAVALLDAAGTQFG